MSSRFTISCWRREKSSSYTGHRLKPKLKNVVVLAIKDHIQNAGTVAGHPRCRTNSAVHLVSSAVFLLIQNFFPAYDDDVEPVC